MKIENPTKLDIFFQGGGIIKFPVKNLKKVDVEPIDGDGGGDSQSVDLTTLDYSDIDSEFKQFLLNMKNDTDFINDTGITAFNNVTDDDFLDNIVWPDAILIQEYNTNKNFVSKDLYYVLFMAIIGSGNYDLSIQPVYESNILEENKYYVAYGNIFKYTSDQAPILNVRITPVATIDDKTYYGIQTGLM